MIFIQKKSGFIIGSIFLFCFIVLSVAEYRGMHAEYKEAWRVAFADPMSDQLDFVVQNDASRTDFHGTLYVDKKPIAEKSFTLGKNETKTFSPQDFSVDPISLHGKIRIRIKDPSGGEREIFKIVESEK